MRRFLRYLRIGFAVACLVACVVCIAFWARSYVYTDQLSGPISESKLLLVGSLAGAVQIRLDDRAWSNPNSFRWKNETGSVAELNKALDDLNALQAKLGAQSPPTRVDWTMKIGWEGNILFLPYWLLVLLTGVPAAAVGMYGHYRLSFSLRTMLIVTALVAVVLGAIVFAAR